MKQNTDEPTYITQEQVSEWLNTIRTQPPNNRSVEAKSCLLSYSGQLLAMASLQPDTIPGQALAFEALLILRALDDFGSFFDACGRHTQKQE